MKKNLRRMETTEEGKGVGVPQGLTEGGLQIKQRIS